VSKISDLASEVREDPGLPIAHGEQGRQDPAAERSGRRGRDAHPDRSPRPDGRV